VTKLNENSVFFVGLATVAYIDEKNVFSVVLGTLPKLKENSVFFLVLVKVAAIGENSLFSPPWGNLSILNVLANVI